MARVAPVQKPTSASMKVTMSEDRAFADRLMGISQISYPADAEVNDDQIRLHELRALFDVFLPSGTEEEITLVFSIQGEMQTQHARYHALLERNFINHYEYAAAVNREVTWSMRQCSAVLGEARTQQLFGLEGVQYVAVVDSELMQPVSTLYGFTTDVRQTTTDLIYRYTPIPRERPQVLKVIKNIDPQGIKRVTHEHWHPKSKYSNLVAKISAAEEAYRGGSIELSIEHADTVVAAVNNLSVISDVPLYLTSWAHHIQGRSYAALTDWRRAALHYECSLAMKIVLKEWLPPLPLFATEIKLGSIELLQSPIEAAMRLERVTDVLSARSKLSKENSRLYRNLLEDSRIGLAEAYIATGNVDLAIDEAKAALRLAQSLHDGVGEIRILGLLCQTSAISTDVAREHILELLQKNARFAVHPRVVSVLGQLGVEQTEADIDSI